MHTTIITVPTHWPSADLCDIEREIVGLIIERAGLDSASRVQVVGVREHGIYRAPSRPGWASIRRSRTVRMASSAIDVRWN